MNKQILEKQMKQRELYVMYWQTIILSGQYKKRQLEHFDHTAFTDEEKLDDAVGIMNNHLQIFNDLLDKYQEGIF